MLSQRVSKTWTAEEIDQYLDNLQQDPSAIEIMKKELTNMGYNIAPGKSEPDYPDDFITNRWYYRIEAPRLYLDDYSISEFITNIKDWDTIAANEDDRENKEWGIYLKQLKVSLTLHKTKFMDVISKNPNAKEARNEIDSIKYPGIGISEKSTSWLIAQNKHQKIDPYNNLTTLDNFLDQEQRKEQDKLKKEQDKTLKRKRKDSPNTRFKKSKQTPKELYITRDENRKFIQKTITYFDPPTLDWEFAILNNIEPGVQDNQRLSKIALFHSLHLECFLPIISPIHVWRLIILRYIPKTDKKFKDDYKKYLTHTEDPEYISRGLWFSSQWTQQQKQNIDVLYDEKLVKNYDNTSLTAPKMHYKQIDLDLDWKSSYGETDTPLNNQLILMFSTSEVPTSNIPPEQTPRFSYTLEFQDKFD